MKKIVSFIIAVLMILAGFAGCKKEELTKEDIYAAIAKTAALESYEMKYEIDMKMISGGESMNTPAKGSTKKALLDGEAVIEHEFVVDFGITKSETLMYIVGDTAYMDVLGKKTKLSAEAASASVPMFDLSEFGKASIINVEAVEDGYAVEFENGSLDTLFDKILGTEQDDAAYKNVTVSFTLNGDGYVTSCCVSFEGSAFDKDLGDYGTVASCTFTYISPGTEVTLTLPELDEYAEE